MSSLNLFLPFQKLSLLSLKHLQMKKIFTTAAFFSAGAMLFAQNIAINTDGTTAETGVMLDVKGATAKATTANSTLFQIKSNNTSTNELKMRLILHSDATGVSSRYGWIDVADYTAGTPTYVNLAVQPYGGFVGIGGQITAPLSPLDVTLAGGGDYKYLVYVHGSNPGLAIHNTNDAITTGLYKFYCSGLALHVYQNTAAAGDFTTNLPIMTWANGGNVGINQQNPAEKLEVNTGNIFINSASNQFIRWNSAGFAPPSLTTRSGGTKIVLWPQVSATEVDYAMGIDAATLWHSVPGNTSTYSHKFYGGTAELMRIRGDGNVGIGTPTPNSILQVRTFPVDLGSFPSTTTGVFFKSQNNNGGSAPAAPEAVMTLAREGISGQAYANFADFKICRYTNVGVEARTRLDLGLTQGNGDAPTTNVMTWRGEGGGGTGTTNPDPTLALDIETTK